MPPPERTHRDEKKAADRSACRRFRRKDSGRPLKDGFPEEESG
jgi:hypothetical protein